MLKKRCSRSDKLANLKTDNARLLWFFCLPHLDVEGRLEADYIILKGTVCPYIQTFDEKGIEESLQDLQRVGLIEYYKINNRNYLQFTRFHDFNKINRSKESASQLPPPNSGATQEQDDSNSGATPAEVKVKLNLSKENELASLLLKKITERKPDFKKPNIRKWSEHIDAMIRIDRRKPELIEKVIVWCQADCGDGGKWKGWQNNILSTAKLREKFDKLELAMNSQKQKAETPKPKTCFVCKEISTAEIQTGRGVKAICSECKKHFESAPAYRIRGGQIMPKEKLEPSVIEEIILKQKAVRK